MPTHSYLDFLDTCNKWHIDPDPCGFPVSDFVNSPDSPDLTVSTNTASTSPVCASTYTFTIGADKISIKSLTCRSIPDIREVIFNGNTTVVIWEDGEKTISKLGEGETFDRYTGFMACVCKRLFGGTTTAKKLMNAKDRDYQQSLREIEALKAAEAAEKKRKELEERVARRKAKRREALIRELMEAFAAEDEARKRYESAKGKE